VIDKLPTTASRGPRRHTRAEQRAATRLALIDATIDCLVEDGYGALTTRRIAERAGVAQSTLMHHFATREALLVEAIPRVATQLAEDALKQIDFAALRSPEHRETVLDQAWREFTSAQAIAAAQLWVAAWSEPELAPTLREIELRLSTIIVTTASALFPDVADDPRFVALIDASVSLIRGLVMAIPVSGREAVDARWQAIKPVLVQASAPFLDQPRSSAASALNPAANVGSTRRRGRDSNPR
jgi:AcrR family transcriptional regulator